jgi:hypothetical protein
MHVLFMILTSQYSRITYETVTAFYIYHSPLKSLSAHKLAFSLHLESLGVVGSDYKLLPNSGEKVTREFGPTNIEKTNLGV